MLTDDRPVTIGELERILPLLIDDALAQTQARPASAGGLSISMLTVDSVGAGTVEGLFDEDEPGSPASIVQGFAEPGDRVRVLHMPGGGAFVIGGAASSSSGGAGGLPDRVTALEVAAAYGGLFFPEDDGAIGDHVADDTDALLACIERMKVAGRGIMLLSSSLGYCHASSLILDAPHLAIQSLTSFSSYLRPTAPMPLGQVVIAANDCAVRDVGFQPADANYLNNPAADCIRIEGARTRTHIERITGFYHNGWLVNAQPAGNDVSLFPPDIYYISDCDTRDGAGGIRCKGGGPTRSVGAQIKGTYMQSLRDECYLFEDCHDVIVTGISGGTTGPDVDDFVATMRIHGDCAAINISSFGLGAQRNLGSRALVIEKDVASGKSPFNINFTDGVIEFAEHCGEITEGDSINFVNVNFTLAGKSGLLVNGPAVASLDNCGFNDNATWESSPPLLSSDTFDRANNTVLGNTDGPREFEPGAWAELAGDWAIDTNLLRVTTIPGGSAPAVVSRDLGESDVTATIKLTARGLDSGLAFRIVDALNFMVLRSDLTGNTRLYKYVAGVPTALGVAHAGNADGDVLGVDLTGSSIIIQRGPTAGSLVDLETIVDATHVAATGYGACARDTVARFDNFVCNLQVGSVEAFEVDVQNAAGIGQTWLRGCKFSSPDVTAATRQKTGNVVRHVGCTNNTGKALYSTAAGYDKPKRIFMPLPEVVAGVVTNYIADPLDLPPDPFYPSVATTPLTVERGTTAVNTGGAPKTRTLPSPAGRTNQTISIVKVDAAAATVTITGHINGAPAGSRSLTAQWQVASFFSNGATWIDKSSGGGSSSGLSPYENVVEYGALGDFDPTLVGGATAAANVTNRAANDAAFAAAWAVAKTRKKQICIPPGHYGISPGILATTDSDAGIVGAGVGNTTLFLVDAAGTGTCVSQSMRELTYWDGSAERIPPIVGFTIDGQFAGAGSVGLRVGPGVGFHIDVAVQSFTGTGGANGVTGITGAIGILMQNAKDTANNNKWTEESTFGPTTSTINCTNCLVVDCGVAGPSFGYNSFQHLFMGPGSGQIGLHITNGAWLYSVDMVMKGNANAGSTIVKVDRVNPTTLSGSRFTGKVALTMECNAATLTVKTIDTDATSVWNTEGLIDFATFSDRAGDADVLGTFHHAGKIAVPGVRPTVGWEYDYGWTRVSGASNVGSVFTAAGDRRVVFRAGLKCRWEEGPATVKYGIVASDCTYDPVTNQSTVALGPSIDAFGWMAATPDFGSMRVSMGNPPDFPQLFTYTPIFTGYSTDPTGILYQYKVDAGICSLFGREATNGVSNLTTATATLPFQAANPLNGLWMVPARVLNNAVGAGGFKTTPGCAQISAGATVVAFGLDYNGTGNFTASNGKRIAAFGPLEYPMHT